MLRRRGGHAKHPSMAQSGNGRHRRPRGPAGSQPAPTAASTTRITSTSTPTAEARRVVFQIPGMEAATVRRDLTYRQAAGGSLELDVYTPPGPLRPRSTILFLHGFPVPPGAKIRGAGQYVSWAQLVAASGLTSVPIDWRGDSAELRDAIQFVRQRAPELGVDPDRLALFGFSAGGGPMLAD